MLAPPQDLLFASFCLPKVLPESFLHNLKEKQKKQKKRNNQKNKKNKKTKKNKKKTKKQKKNPEGNVSARVSSESFFFLFFGLFGLRLLRAYSWKNTFHYRPLVFTISLRKRLFPKYFRQFILNFFLWRPDFSKGSSLLSLKTGLFQREVASREESSIWTNRLCVKQDFVKRKKIIIWTKLVRWGLSCKKKCYLERKWIIRKNVF